MTESGLRKGLIISETATGVEKSTHYYLMHEGTKYPIPHSLVRRLVLVENTFAFFGLENGTVTIPKIFDNQKLWRQ